MTLTREAIETVQTLIGPLDFELGLPTEKTVTRLFDEMDFQRACQAYLWALPVVGFAHSRAMHRKVAGAGPGDVITYEGYETLRAILTPNVTTPYIVFYADLGKNGPTVMEVPAGQIAGSAMDFWQRALVDFGLTGPDKGKGGRYLFVGPGQDAPKADNMVVVRSPTLTAFCFYRALDPDPAKAEALKKSVRIYPWSQRENPPATRYLTPNANEVAKLRPIPQGMEYWELVAQVVDEEPVQDRDRFFVAMLRPLGIEKGKPFKPTARQKKILTDGALVGEAMAKANSFDKRFDGSRYRPDAHWDYVIMADPAQDLEHYSQFDERAAYFYEAVALSKGMITKTAGEGQAYLASYRDKDGHAFDGERTYHLRVPSRPPMKQFWSVTVYDVDTRSIIQNTERIADRSSRQDLVTNGDGSVDLYFGPTVPKGFEKNWIPTTPGMSWFTYLRLYAPTEAYFDKSWPLPDIEPVP